MMFVILFTYSLRKWLGLGFMIYLGELQMIRDTKFLRHF